MAEESPPAPPGWPALGHTVGFARDPFGFVAEAVESTGDVFRMRLLGKDVTVVAHPDHVGAVLRDRERFAKLDDFTVAFGEALLAVEGDQWRRQRHAMEDFFSPTRIGEYASTMSALAHDRLDGWDAPATVRLDEEMRVLALENLFEVVLGHSIAGAELASLTEAAHALNGWFEPTSWVLPDWVPTPARRRFRRGSAALRERARSLLSAAGTDPDADSLLATLASLREDPTSGFDESAVLDQVVGMLFAGHETTALAMTYALHQLGLHPAVAERAAAEVDAVLDGRATLSDLQDLEYVERVVDETLRLYPPVHAIPRVTTEAVEVGDWHLPAGEQVLLSVWNVHRDSRFYDAPRTFDPDRWAGTSPREKADAFVPFGSGARICIGRHFARLEMKAVLAAVLSRYRLEASDEIAVAPQMTAQPDGPVRVHVESR
ncbi:MULTISPECIES: cytochrome P450 [Haloarcula]|uniref:cytochrome P450 n=1 Tax=Haloarcula TaxID=2237 RepID=UPI0023EBDA23|nr:cytochrome P450 [Halomicroarcula sp. XH51]